MIRTKHKFSTLLVCLTITAASLIASACTSTQTMSQRTVAANGEKTAVSSAQESDLLTIFREAELHGDRKSSSTIDVSEPVEDFVTSNCVNRSCVIQLLERNGFEVTTGGKYFRQSVADVPYDERIAGVKNGPRFLYFYTTYKSYVFIKDGVIVDVKAYRFHEGL